jgi:hypothetical protein
MTARPARPTARSATRVATTRRTLVAVAAVAALAGCGGGAGTVNTGELRTTIREQFQDQGIVLRDIACRDGVEAEEGAAVSCSARNAADTELVIEGRVTAVRDGKATFAAKAVRGVAKGEVVAAEARRLLERRVGQKAAGMTCPDRVPLPTTPTVRCVLTTAQGPRYEATVRLDARNRLNVQLADTAMPER